MPEEVFIATSEAELPSETDGFLASSWLAVGDPNPETFMAWIEASSWTFDGAFYSTSTRVELSQVPVETSTEEFDIWKLPIHPVRFAKDKVAEAQRRRGEMFWKCRFRKYISYVEQRSDPSLSEVIIFRWPTSSLFA